MRSIPFLTSINTYFDLYHIHLAGNFYLNGQKQVLEEGAPQNWGSPDNLRLFQLLRPCCYVPGSRRDDRYVDPCCTHKKFLVVEVEAHRSQNQVLPAEVAAMMAVVPVGDFDNRSYNCPGHHDRSLYALDYRDRHNALDSVDAQEAHHCGFDLRD